VVPLQAPPLRERKEDIPLLAQHFLTRFNQRNGTRRTLTQAALQKIATYDFPGTSASWRTWSSRRRRSRTGTRSRPTKSFLETRPAAQPEADASGVRTLGQEVDEAERKAIDASMERNGGSIEKVARELGVSTTTLWRKMKRLGMRKE